MSVLEKRKRVLAIDDDAAILRLLRERLAPFYDVTTASDGAEGIRAARANLPDIILLDLNLPTLDGAEFCRLMRDGSSTHHIPIIMVSGADDSESRSRAFETGADDFIGKPFSVKELITRIKSKERWLGLGSGGKAEPEPETLACGNLALNLANLEVTIEGRRIPMSVLHFNLLKFFVENRGRVLARDRVLEAVWKETVVSDRTVDSHISQLRKLLVEGAFSCSLETVYGAGYVLRIN